MEISSTLTQKIYVDFYMFMQKKNIKTFKICGGVILGFALLITLLIFVGNSSTAEIVEDLEIQIPLFAIFVALGLFMIFGYKPLLLRVTTRTYALNSFVASEPIATYQFNDNNFQMLTTSKLGIEDCTYSYEIINRIIESDTYIFIFIATNQAFIITKSEDLDLNKKIIELLKTKTENKYTECICKK